MKTLLDEIFAEYGFERIAKKLGVEIGEEFRLYYNGKEAIGNSVYRFTETNFESGIKFEDYLNVPITWTQCILLLSLLEGTYQVVKEEQQ